MKLVKAYKDGVEYLFDEWKEILKYRYKFNDGTWSLSKLTSEGLGYSSSNITFDTTQGAVSPGDYDIYRNLGAIGGKNGIHIKYVGGSNNTNSGNFFGFSTQTHAYNNGFGLNISYASSSNCGVRLGGSAIYNSILPGATSTGVDNTIEFDYNKTTGLCYVTMNGNRYNINLTSSQMNTAISILNNSNMYISINPYRGYCKEWEFYYY